jgi:hypothetical protein
MIRAYGCQGIIRAYGVYFWKALFFFFMAEAPKDPVAQAMAGKRWAKTTAKQRSAIAVRMNEARWGKKKPGKKKP